MNPVSKLQGLSQRTKYSPRVSTVLFIYSNSTQWGHRPGGFRGNKTNKKFNNGQGSLLNGLKKGPYTDITATDGIVVIPLIVHIK